MRSQKTNVRGPIALIKKGSGQIIGIANLVDVKGPFSRQELQADVDKHHITLDRLASPETAKWNTAWVLSDAKPLTSPVPYEHPNGAVIWVNLEPEVVRAIHDQLPS